MTRCRCDNELPEGSLDEVVTPLRAMNGQKVEFCEVFCGRCGSRRVYTLQAAPWHVRQYIAATNPMRVRDLGIF